MPRSVVGDALTCICSTLKEIEILVERRTKKKLQYYLLPGRPSKTKDAVTRLSKKLDEACQVFQVSDFDSTLLRLAIHERQC